MWIYHTIKQIDLPSTACEEDSMIPILNSIISSSGCSLRQLELPKQWQWILQRIIIYLAERQMVGSKVHDLESDGIGNLHCS